MNQRSDHLKNITLCGFFACLTAVFSQIVIPIQPIPVNLATLAVMLSGGLLGAKWGAVSQIVYTLMGVLGLPVFAEMMSGVGVLAGPSGGYIVGYILAAWTAGAVKYLIQPQDSGNEQNKWKRYLPYLAAVPACYYPGTLWYMYVTGSALLPALLLCVVPFFIGDLLKVACAGILVSRLEEGLRYV